MMTNLSFIHLEVLIQNHAKVFHANTVLKDLFSNLKNTLKCRCRQSAISTSESWNDINAVHAPSVTGD